MNLHSLTGGAYAPYAPYTPYVATPLKRSIS